MATGCTLDPSNGHIQLAMDHFKSPACTGMRFANTSETLMMDPTTPGGVPQGSCLHVGEHDGKEMHFKFFCDVINHNPFFAKSGMMIK